MSVLEQLQKAKQRQQKLLAILLDPDKVDFKDLNNIILKINTLKADFIFVGGSFVKSGLTQKLVDSLKKITAIKVVLFPGDVSQISQHADALLFMSLLSGLNPEYLISQQIKAVPKLKNTNIEIIPTGYILIDGGQISSVEQVSQTKPIRQNQGAKIVNTSIAAEFMGKKLLYLEAGSGALFPIKTSIIKKVASKVDIPIIVGGGIRTQNQLQKMYSSGADLVVIGTAFEENNLLLKSDKK